MMTIRILIFLSFLILISCHKNNSPDYSVAIQGDWIFIKEPNKNQFLIEGYPPPPPPPFGNILKGFSFFSDSICDYKLGYFKIIYLNGERINKFLGTKTKFTLKGDSLKIFNLEDSVWDGYKIFNINKDTLTFQLSDSVFTRYTKLNNENQNSSLFDKVVVSSSGCFGNCPISDFMIDKYGNVDYHGQEYNTLNGYYTAKVNENLFFEIKNRFDKAGFIKLGNSYTIQGTDHEEITVTFIKYDRIIKTISDYGRQSPSEFYWAYTPARYLYQKLTLDTITNIPSYLNFKEIIFRKEGKVLELSKSESFYLWTLLLKSKRVSSKFTPKYNLSFYPINKNLVIKTDGRFYLIENKDEKDLVLDLGFDFIIENQLEKRIREKYDYE